uniref:Uncharacterized protein LOC104218184 isoform X1 n=1 Tax=Nicotiana sylvestris TaxID=4096 RepID=A0A1U7VFS6_NICSY|nr:PREDICTED: uncharacterized protein LOC104218184 isoform X1 [Nicotiana sylvestris]XP_009766912.1 PREDICTED: uncharacterized protein LOC104218184 isoform X2 [Nicotiana sylvestris]XP_009766913.1 PREDICTED: uncharacterized protein LOC104218184 isoform X3 [Nicotiana sylvestris]XP_009766915.1 PREDICTED: uncharacterized protein LOC104218184 isoform X5 [Nicotiana sylvestris]
MSVASSPQPLAVGEPSIKPTYAAQIQTKSPTQIATKTVLKSIQYVHGEPTVCFTMEERREFAMEEGLYQSVVFKLSSGAPDLKELRNLLPKHLGTKGRCLVGSLAPRQILLRFDQNEDYVQALARAVNYRSWNGKEHQCRVFPWTIGFNPNEETTMAVVWISLPNLSPELFAMRSLLSIASAAGKPIAIDKSTQIKSRPSTTRVKVILDLMNKHPKRVRIQSLDKNSGKIVEVFQEIVYDNLPLYCNCCKHQGHDEKTCRYISKRAHKNDEIKDVEVFQEPIDQGPVEQYQGDLRQLLNARKMQQVLEGKSVDPDNNFENNSLVYHQGADVNKQNIAATQSALTDGPRPAVVKGQLQNDRDTTAAREIIGKPPFVQSTNVALKNVVALNTKLSDIPASTVFSRMYEATAVSLKAVANRTDNSNNLDMFKHVPGPSRIQSEVVVSECAATGSQMSAGAEQDACGSLKNAVQEKVETKTTGKANGSAEPKDTFVELTDKATNVDATNEEHRVDVMELEFAASDTKGNKSNNWTEAIEAAAAATIVSKLDCTVALQSPVNRVVSRSDKHGVVIDLIERTANPMDTDVALKAVRADTSNQPDMVQ